MLPAGLHMNLQRKTTVLSLVPSPTMYRTFSNKTKQLWSHHLVYFLKRCQRENEEKENVCQMVQEGSGVSSPRVLHSPRCWLASHLHTLHCGLGSVSIFFLFLAVLSRKGKNKNTSLNLCSFLKSLRHRELRSKQGTWDR